MSWQREVDDLERRHELARQHGGPERVERQYADGKLTIRERIDQVVDPGSFQEVGRLTGAGTYVDGRLDALTPAPYVMGLARIDGREVAIGGEDFTVRGGSGGGLDRCKGGQGGFVEDLAYEYRIPLINLIDGAGGSVRSIMRQGHAQLPGVDTFERSAQLLGRVPVLSAVLGSCAGGPAGRAVLSHWSVMADGTSHVFAAGPAVVARALGREPTKDALGGADVAVDMAGCIDNRAPDEATCFAQLRQVLGYLPQNVWDMPPRGPVSDPVDRRETALLSIIPRNRRRMYNMHRLLRLITDCDSCFELQPTYGRAAITCLARFNGYPVGIVANNPMVIGGAVDVAAARKIEHFAGVCDTFHLPLIFFVDTPGFMVGEAAEEAGTLRAGMRALYVVQQASVPKISVIVRKCYGMGGALSSTTDSVLKFRLAWPSAEWGSLPIEGGVAVAYRREISRAENPAEQQQALEDELLAMNAPVHTAESFGVEDMIDPRDTRPLLCRFIASAQPALRTALGPTYTTGVRP